MWPGLTAASVFTNYPSRAQGCSVKNLCPPTPQVGNLQPEGNSVWEAVGNGSSEGRVVIHSQQADLLLGLPTAPAAAAEVSRQDKAAQGTMLSICNVMRPLSAQMAGSNLVRFQYVVSCLCSMLVLFCNGPQVCPALFFLQAPPYLPCRWTLHQAAP